MTLKVIAWVKVLLVICKIIRLFVNALTTDDKHSLLNGDNLTQPIQIQFSQKQKTFSEVFFCIFKTYIKFWIYFKKGRPESLINCRYSRFRKTSLDKCLKSSVSEDPRTDDITNGLKDCCNLNESTFTIFINDGEGNCVGKSLF